MDNRPIGVFDSGLGGLTVVKEIKKILPGETIVYLGDTARVPYGTRSAETIVKFSLQCADYLVQQNIKALVIACNTASAYAYEEIKARLPIPVFEVIDFGVKGVRAGDKKVGVLGTPATVESRAYEKEIIKIRPGVEVMSVACPLFVPEVEAGEVSGEIVRLTAEKYVHDLKNWGADSVILGCTHYPVIQNIISEVLDNKVTLINPGAYLAVGLAEFLKDEGWAADKKGEDRYLFTDMKQNLAQIAEVFLGGKMEGSVEKINLE